MAVRKPCSISHRSTPEHDSGVLGKKRGTEVVEITNWEENILLLLFFARTTRMDTSPCQAARSFGGNEF